MKKVLIFSVTAGNGHKSAANTVKAELETQGAIVQVVDFLEENPLYFWYADSGYNLTCRYIIWAFNYFYRKYAREKRIDRYHSSTTNAVIAAAKRNYKIICDFQPDVIYGPHYYTSVFIAYLKAMGVPTPFKTILSGLDYDLCPYYPIGADAVDKYIVADESIIPAAIQKGFRPEQVESWGVPIKPSFLKTYDRRQERIRLGLQPDKPTFIVMFGGGVQTGGTKIFRALVRALANREAQIIKINGYDNKGYRSTVRTAKKLPKNLTVLNVRYTTEIERYIAASDLAISKCGGLSSTELAALGVPLLTTEHLAQQEKYNLAFWKSKGVARSFRNTRQLYKEINSLLGHPDVLAEMSINAKSIQHHSTTDIAAWIMAQPKAEYNADEINAIDMRHFTANMHRAIRRAYKADKRAARLAKKNKRADSQ